MLRQKQNHKGNESLPFRQRFTGKSETSRRAVDRKGGAGGPHAPPSHSPGPGLARGPRRRRREGLRRARRRRAAPPRRLSPGAAGRSGGSNEARSAGPGPRSRARNRPPAPPLPSLVGPSRGRGPPAAIGRSAPRRAGRGGGVSRSAPAPGPPIPYLAPAPTGPGRRRLRGAAGPGPQLGAPQPRERPP